MKSYYLVLLFGWVIMLQPAEVSRGQDTKYPLIKNTPVIKKPDVAGDFDTSKINEVIKERKDMIQTVDNNLDKIEKKMEKERPVKVVNHYIFTRTVIKHDTIYICDTVRKTDSFTKYKVIYYPRYIQAPPEKKHGWLYNIFHKKKKKVD